MLEISILQNFNLYKISIYTKFLNSGWAWSTKTSHSRMRSSNPTSDGIEPPSAIDLREKTEYFRDLRRSGGDWPSLSVVVGSDFPPIRRV